VWGFKEQEEGFDKKTQCSKMTLLCRDVFNTIGDDSFGHGPGVAYAGHAKPNPIAVLVALCAGLLASSLVFYALRGGFDKDAARGDRGIQFTRVSNEDNLTAS
jgi:hypothetical protein